MKAREGGHPAAPDFSLLPPWAPERAAAVRNMLGQILSLWKQGGILASFLCLGINGAYFIRFSKIGICLWLGLWLQEFQYKISLSSLEKLSGLATCFSMKIEM